MIIIITSENSYNNLMHFEFGAIFKAHKLVEWRTRTAILVTPSVPPSACLSVCPSVDKIVSALYPAQYQPDPFHVYTSYQAISEDVSHLKVIAKFPNLNCLAFFWNLKL